MFFFVFPLTGLSAFLLNLFCAIYQITNGIVIQRKERGGGDVKERKQDVVDENGCGEGRDG